MSLLRRVGGHGSVQQWWTRWFWLSRAESSAQAESGLALHSLAQEASKRTVEIC
jgi:hypothetical protein